MLIQQNLGTTNSIDATYTTTTTTTTITASVTTL